jgi:hypothetical protein
VRVRDRAEVEFRPSASPGRGWADQLRWSSGPGARPGQVEVEFKLNSSAGESEGAGCE